MSAVMVIASDAPLEEAVSPAEELVVLSAGEGKNRVSITFDNDFAVWPFDGYLEIPSKKKHFAELYLYNPDCGEKVVEYLKNHLRAAPDLELWHVWLDGETDHRVRKAEIGIADLTPGDIRELSTLEVSRAPIIYYCYLITH